MALGPSFAAWFPAFRSLLNDVHAFIEFSNALA